MLFQDPNVKVFISFDSVDSQLAYQLKGILEDGGISCYLFDVTPRCGLSLAEKIMNEIDTSHALVAIIMDRSSSASVHREIGYAIAKDVQVILMMENDADDGVLTPAKKKEVFTKDDFEISCKRILKYLRDEVSEIFTAEDFIKFLQEQKLTPATAPHFGKGGSASKLSYPETASVSGNPAVLFSACPTRLLSALPVTSRGIQSVDGRLRQGAYPWPSSPVPIATRQSSFQENYTKPKTL